MRRVLKGWVAKLIIVAVVVVLVAVVLVWTVGRLQTRESKTHWWQRNPLKIEETRVILQGVRGIGELTCACYCEDVVMHYKKPSPQHSITLGQSEMVMIVSGKVRLGVDLGTLSDSNFAWQGDTLVITLPQTKILEIETNPSSIDFFVEKGDWTHGETTKIQGVARRRLAANARQSGTVQRAATLAQEKVTEILKGAGVEKVKVLIAK